MGKKAKSSIQQRLTAARNVRLARRASKGKLGLHMVTPGTLQRYEKALLQLFAFWAVMQLAPSSLLQLTAACQEYVEYLWANGDAHSLGSDALAGLQFFVPDCFRHLRLAWKLLKVWQRLEPPNRAIPFSPLLVLGFAGACVQANLIEAAAVLLVGFDTMMRSGELYSVKVKDITFRHSKAIIRLPTTKTSARKGAAEVVVCESALAVRWLWLSVANKSPDDLLLSCGAAKFRLIFTQLKVIFGITDNLSVYSLRRGGATWDFLNRGSMERTLLRGRWQSNASARIYLQDAAAAVSLLKLTAEQTSKIKFCLRSLV
jgi:integrase